MLMRWGLGWLRRRKSSTQMAEVLEAIDALERGGRSPSVKAISAVTGLGSDEVRRVLSEAADKGLVSVERGRPRLTDKGRASVLEHRTRYVHDLVLRPPPPLATLSRVWEREVSSWGDHLVRNHGIDQQVVQRLMEYRGRIEQVVPLTSLAEGERGEVVFVLGGRGAVRRLWDMGLTPGTEVILARRAPFMGPVEVLVRGTSLALGRGIASRVFVRVKR